MAIRRYGLPARLFTGQHLGEEAGGKPEATPNGVMTDHRARLMNVGGEVLCKVI